MSSRIEAHGRLRRRFDIVEFLNTVEVWRQRTRSRSILARLPDEALKDIGLTRADAVGESRKPFWRD